MTPTADDGTTHEAGADRTGDDRTGRRDGRRDGPDHVLVVGGGYAGLHAAAAARGAGVAVTLVDDSGRHDFVTRLAAVAGGTAPPGDAARPLDGLADRVVTGRVTRVAEGTVTLHGGRTLEAGAVVVTVGAAPSRPPVPGIERTLPLRSATDAMLLRARIECSGSVVVIGAGATGVQLAGAVAHAHPTTTVHLVDAEEVLLAGLPPALGAGAQRILRSRGVHLHLGRPVERITTTGVMVDDAHLEGTVVWAGGFEARAGGLGLPVDDGGRVLVDAHARVQGRELTFAAGDVAAHPDRAGGTAPMSAQVAVRAGAAAGANAARTVLGRPTRPVTLAQLGWVLDLGGRRGVARVGPLDLAAPVLDLIPPLLHEIIDLKDLVETGGSAALRFAPSSVHALLRLPGWLTGRGAGAEADRRPRLGDGPAPGAGDRAVPA